MRLALIYLSLFVVPLNPVWAQKAKYSDPIMGEVMYIAGAVGNTIHAWSVSKQSRQTFRELNVLTLHIFSQRLELLDEKKISLGESALTKIDFQMENSFYYINIIYTSRSGVNKRLMYKVDAAGKLTDVTAIPGLLTKPHYSSVSPSAAVNSSNIFVAKISASVADSSIIDVSLPPGENFDNKQPYEKLAIQKISIDKRQVLGEKVYASGYLNFSYLRVTATDSMVYACALAQSKTGINKNPYNGSYLFLARLDTNLVEPANGTILLRNKKWPANLLFIPNAIFALNNKLLVLSTGLFTGSAMITQTDYNNHLLADTIIKIKQGREQLEWGNRFVLPANNEVHLFCSRLHTASKGGITLFTIGQDGKVGERELIVYENYYYALRQAVSLEPGVLLVPYTYKRNTGLMKLAYETTE